MYSGDVAGLPAPQTVRRSSFFLREVEGIDPQDILNFLNFLTVMATWAASLSVSMCPLICKCRASPQSVTNRGTKFGNTRRRTGAGGTRWPHLHRRGQVRQDIICPEQLVDVNLGPQAAGRRCQDDIYFIPDNTTAKKKEENFQTLLVVEN